MNLDEEREAFEALQNQKIFKWFEFDSSVNAYVLKDISASLEKLTALAELNYGWDMWQAAKAQAIPDGFVVVPKDLIQSIHQSCVRCLDIDLLPIFRATICTIRDEVATLIEAQEPTND